MNRFHLHRVSSSHKVTMGALVHQGIPILVTIEPPWKFNRPTESCAPEGVYLCERYVSEHYPVTALAWQVKDVTGRTSMLIHAGNTVKDSKGCTLLGTGFGILEGEPAVLNSKEALRILNQVTGGEPFELIIHGK